MSYTDPCARCGFHRADCDCGEKGYLSCMPDPYAQTTAIKTFDPQKLIQDSSHAVFSPCGQYRYALWRKWSDKPYIMFIGLNPSTANATSDDPTIRRVKRFAKDWGYGGVYMLNLFAIVSAYPEILKTHSDPLGANNEWLIKYAAECDAICFAWGNFKEATERAKEVEAMFPNAICLGLNKNGTPKHPLYVATNITQINYK